MDIEDEFDISMPVNLLADVHTVKDLADKDSLRSQHINIVIRI